MDECKDVIETFNENNENVKNVENNVEFINSLEEEKKVFKKKIREKKCEVTYSNKKKKEVFVNFSGHGIRLQNIEAEVGDFVTVKYSGRIGTSKFEIVD